MTIQPKSMPPMAVKNSRTPATHDARVDLLLAFAEAHTAESDVGATMRALASEVRVLRGELATAIAGWDGALDKYGALLTKREGELGDRDLLRDEVSRLNERVAWHVRNAEGLASDRAELMNAGDRYPEVAASLRAALEKTFAPALCQNPCPRCGDERVIDSGGVSPSGAGIDLPCPACLPERKHP